MPLQRAFYLAASSPHSSDRLLALPIASCGLRLNDKAVRVAIGIRLGLPICIPHQCHCRMQVDTHGIHSFVCKRAPGRTARHQALNKLIAPAFVSADMPVIKEPSGLARADGKGPDGLSLIPRQEGRPLCWGVTVVCSTANSYLQTANMSAGSAAEMAAIHARFPNTRNWQLNIPSNPLPSSLLAQWTVTPATFWLISGGESPESPMMTERFLFCFSIFLFFFISTRFCCLIALSWVTDWSFSLSDVCFLA